MLTLFLGLTPFRLCGCSLSGTHGGANSASGHQTYAAGDGTQTGQQQTPDAHPDPRRICSLHLSVCCMRCPRCIVFVRAWKLLLVEQVLSVDWSGMEEVGADVCERI